MSNPYLVQGQDTETHLYPTTDSVIHTDYFGESIVSGIDKVGRGRLPTVFKNEFTSPEGNHAKAVRLKRALHKTGHDISDYKNALANVARLENLIPADINAQWVALDKGFWSRSGDSEKYNERYRSLFNNNLRTIDFELFLNGKKFKPHVMGVFIPPINPVEEQNRAASEYSRNQYVNNNAAVQYKDAHHMVPSQINTRQASQIKEESDEEEPEYTDEEMRDMRAYIKSRKGKGKKD